MQSDTDVSLAVFQSKNKPQSCFLGQRTVHGFKVNTTNQQPALCFFFLLHTEMNFLPGDFDAAHSSPWNKQRSHYHTERVWRHVKQAFESYYSPHPDEADNIALYRADILVTLVCLLSPCFSAATRWRSKASTCADACVIMQRSGSLEAGTVRPWLPRPWITPHLTFFSSFFHLALLGRPLALIHSSFMSSLLWSALTFGLNNSAGGGEIDSKGINKSDFAFKKKKKIKFYNMKLILNHVLIMWYWIRKLVGILREDLGWITLTGHTGCNPSAVS